LANRVTNIIDFTLVYNQYKNQLYNYVCKMLYEKHIAEDITQNVFLRLYENLGNIRKSQSIASWLFTTARNEVFGHLRRKQIKKEDFMKEEFEYRSNEDIVGSFEEAELKELVQNGVDKMNDELKEVFILREYSELSYKEIANILCIEESLVKGRLFRARQILVDRISKLVR